MGMGGKRGRRPLAAKPTAELLEEGLRWLAEQGKLESASTFIPKGIYRFRTHEEAEEHRISCLARGMAEQRKKDPL